MIFPLLKMILILNDTAHCWENETSIAASPFECPREFIKSTSFLRSKSDLHSCTSPREYSRTKVRNRMHATECRVIICAERHTIWQWARPNISHVKRLFLVRYLVFPSICAEQIAHEVEEGVEMLCCVGYYPNLTSHFKACGTGLIPVSDRDVQPKRYFLYFSK